MALASPPASIVNAIAQLSPGFWAQWSNAVAFAYQQAGGFTFTSWWRSVQHNQEVGGSDFSQHLIGVALDIVPVTLRNAQALQSAGFQVVNEGDHLHAQPFPAGTVTRGLLSYLGIG